MNEYYVMELVLFLILLKCKIIVFLNIIVNVNDFSYVVRLQFMLQVFFGIDIFYLVNNRVFVIYCYL